MRVIKSAGLIVLGVLLGIAGSTATARVEAQAPRSIQPGQEIQAGQPVGTFITGENIGFQLIATPTRPRRCSDRQADDQGQRPLAPGRRFDGADACPVAGLGGPR